MSKKIDIEKNPGLLLLEEFIRITGLTNKQIAELYGCSINYTHKMRSGFRTVQIDKIFKIILNYGFTEVGFTFKDGDAKAFVNYPT